MDEGDVGVEVAASVDGATHLDEEESADQTYKAASDKSSARVVVDISAGRIGDSSLKIAKEVR